MLISFLKSSFVLLGLLLEGLETLREKGFKFYRGDGPAFGSGLDYNAGVASAHTFKITASDRVEIYLGNSSNLIANGRLCVPCQGSGWTFRCFRCPVCTL